MTTLEALRGVSLSAKMQEFPDIQNTAEFGGKMVKFHETRGLPKLARGGYPEVKFGRGIVKRVPGAQLNAGDCRKNNSEGIF